MRGGSKETVVMTGATGFLGSHLLAALLSRGVRVVVLGRALDGVSLEQRLARQLDWFDLGARKRQVTSYEVDLLAHHFGLSRGRYLSLCVTADKIVHLASDTHFAESNRVQSLNANVRTLASVLEFAKDGAAFFHYVSTAYTAGVGSSLCREVLNRCVAHANVYEETKAWAEQEVLAFCEREEVPYTILRPSIVYGDSRTGRANRFTALYHHVRSLAQIRDIYRRDLLDQGGGKSRPHGIRLDASDVLHLPLKIFLPVKGSVNLVPIDYFVAAALAIFDHPHSGDIYHLTSSDPESMEDLACYCEKFLGLNGIQICYGPLPQHFRSNPAEALFNKFIEPYRPYLADTRTFDRSNTDRTTKGLVPPKLTYEVFHLCMQYAHSVNWGR